MDLQRKKDIIEAGFGFDKLKIDEVINLCLDIDGEDTLITLKSIEEELGDEI